MKKIELLEYSATGLSMISKELIGDKWIHANLLAFIAQTMFFFWSAKLNHRGVATLNLVSASISMRSEIKWVYGIETGKYIYPLTAFLLIIYHWKSIKSNFYRIYKKSHSFIKNYID